MARSLGAEPGGRRGSPPSVIGDTIATAVTARRPKTRYPAGFGVRPALLLQRLLPDRAFDAFIRRASGIPA